MFQRTFGMIKPDAVAAANIGEIITAIEDEEMRLVGLGMRRLTYAEAVALYAEHEGKHFFGGLIDFTLSGPVVLMAIEGEDAIESYRQLMTGILRPVYGTDVRRNAVHGSAGFVSAERELQLFFPGLVR